MKLRLKNGKIIHLRLRKAYLHKKLVPELVKGAEVLSKHNKVFRKLSD